jgi:hypothetical protein
MLAEKLPNIDENYKQLLHQTLTLADLAKFAKQEPLGSENEKALKQAVEFVEHTALKAEEIPENEHSEQKDSHSAPSSLSPKTEVQ